MTDTYQSIEIQRLAIENDPTIFSEILQQYHGIAEFLLETPDDAIAGINPTIVSEFKKTYGESAFLCRYSPCPRATLGFSNNREREKHESSHTRKFKCADSSCEFYESGFSTKATLQKHNEIYHRKIHDFILPIRRRSRTSDLREKFTDSKNLPSRPPRASTPQRPAGQRLHLSYDSEKSITDLQVPGSHTSYVFPRFMEEAPVLPKKLSLSDYKEKLLRKSNLGQKRHAQSLQSSAEVEFQASELKSAFKQRFHELYPSEKVENNGERVNVKASVAKNLEPASKQTTEGVRNTLNYADVNGFPTNGNENYNFAAASPLQAPEIPYRTWSEMPQGAASGDDGGNFSFHTSGTEYYGEKGGYELPTAPPPKSAIPAIDYRSTSTTIASEMSRKSSFFSNPSSSSSLDISRTNQKAQYPLNMRPPSPWLGDGSNELVYDRQDDSIPNLPRQPAGTIYDESPTQAIQSPRRMQSGTLLPFNPQFGGATTEQSQELKFVQDPLVQWYTGHDGPWIPKGSNSTAGKDMYKGMSDYYQGSYRHRTPTGYPDITTDFAAQYTQNVQSSYQVPSSVRQQPQALQPLQARETMSKSRVEPLQSTWRNGESRDVKLPPPPYEMNLPPFPSPTSMSGASGQRNLDPLTGHERFDSITQNQTPMQIAHDNGVYQEALGIGNFSFSDPQVQRSTSPGIPTHNHPSNHPHDPDILTPNSQQQEGRSWASSRTFNEQQPMNKELGTLTSRQIASLEPEARRKYEQAIQIGRPGRRLNPAPPRNDVHLYLLEESYQRQLQLKEKLALPSDSGTIPKIDKPMSDFYADQLYNPSFENTSAPYDLDSEY